MSEQKQRVYDALNKLGIKYEVVEHFIFNSELV